MRLLLDTCTFLWLAAEPARLSRAAKRALDAPRSELVLSDVVVWEICLKWKAGKLGLPSPPRQFVEQQAREWNVERLPLAATHMYRTTELPDHHKDPFDRLLAAQSIEETLTIVTPDPLIRAYPVSVLW